MRCRRGVAPSTARKNVLEEEPQKGALKDLCAGQELSNHLVLTAPPAEGLYGASFDLSSMGRGELCRDQHAVLVQTVRMRSAKLALAQPNRIQKRTVQAMYLSVGYSDL